MGKVHFWSQLAWQWWDDCGVWVLQAAFVLGGTGVFAGCAVDLLGLSAEVATGVVLAICATML